jgi:hypothetical protein
MLLKIASHCVSLGLVVAAGKSVEARPALRKGTDEAERSRFGGIGGFHTIETGQVYDSICGRLVLTIKEAEQVLRTDYNGANINSASRKAAGRAFSVDRVVCDYDGHVDAFEAGDGHWVTNNTDFCEVMVCSRFIRTLIAYGADPNVSDPDYGATTPLHFVAEYAPPDAVYLCRLLLAAGADIDAECAPGNTAGRSPLSWALTVGPLSERRYEVAKVLIEAGCDVVKAEAAYRDVDSDRETLLEALHVAHASSQARALNEQILDLISAALEAAGPERREAALHAARGRRDAWVGAIGDSHGLGFVVEEGF